VINNFNINIHFISAAVCNGIAKIAPVL